MKRSKLSENIWRVEEGEEGNSFAPGWYFEDETEDLHGPYATEEEAQEQLRRYCETL